MKVPVFFSLLLIALLGSNFSEAQQYKELYFNAENLKVDSDTSTIYCTDCGQNTADLIARYTYLASIQNARPRFEKRIPLIIDVKDTLGMDTQLKARQVVSGYLFIDAEGYVRKVLAIGSTAPARLSFISNVALANKYIAGTNVKQTRVLSMQKLLKERWVRIDGIVYHQYFWDDYRPD